MLPNKILYHKMTPISAGKRMQLKWNHLKFRIPFAALLRFSFYKKFPLSICSFVEQHWFSIVRFLFSFFIISGTRDSIHKRRIRWRSWRCLPKVETRFDWAQQIAFPSGVSFSSLGVQIGWGSSTSSTLSSFENWFIGLPAGLAGERKTETETSDTQIPWTTSECAQIFLAHVYAVLLNPL